MSNEPGSAVLAIFDQLIERVKQSRPVRSDGKPLGGGVVYSMMTLGMPVDPEDYLHPWSPMGGASAQGPSAPPAAAAPTAPAAPGAAGATAGAASAAPPPDPKYARALEAAYKTAQLCNILLQVTTDGTYLEYPTGRHLDFAYESIISALQPGPMPPIAPAIQQQINDAQKVLYELDPDDGSITGKSKLFRTYEKNAAAYATAKANYAIAMAHAKADPAQAEIWPQISATYQQTVDDAYDTFKTEGAEKVERALDIIGSVGISLQDHMVKKARQLFDAYNLGLAGVPAPIPYSFIEPSGWCDPDNDDEGWQQLKVSSKDTRNYSTSRSDSLGQYSWMNNSSTTGGGGGVSFMCFAGGGSGSTTSAHGQDQKSSSYQFTSAFKNTATDLEISLEYMLATITRPWLVSDLFYMRGDWYMVNQKKGSISDGTQTGQANIADPDKWPLLPMIPQQMLLIRNVVITSSSWGSDGQVLDSIYNGNQDSTDSSSTSVAATGGVCLGFVNFGGSASHSDTHARGQGSNWDHRSATSNFGTTFEKGVLKIPGAQIIAFLSDIVPACPPKDDPGLAPAKDDKKKVTADTLQPAS